MLNKDSNWYKIKNDNNYRTSILNDLCFGIDKINSPNSSHVKELIKMFNYIIDEKSEIFEKDEFQGKLHEDDDELLDLILPAVKRVYGNIFINPPGIFVKSMETKRLQLFQVSFNIDDFVDYLVEMILNNKNLLKDFNYIDRTATTLGLIVDNYIAKLVTMVRNCDDFTQEIRNIKIEKIQK